MKTQFPKLAMSSFSESLTGQNLTPLHASNPEPFTQSELESVVGVSFAEILQDVPLGFCADAGSEKLRDSLSKHLYDSSTATDVITHAGAQEALFCAYHAVLEAEDRVLVVAPVFEPLLQIPINIGCEVSMLHLKANDDWSLDLNLLEQQFKLGCKMFVINYPHNPTGAQLTRDELLNIIKLCDKYDVWLLSDEVFRGLEHDDKDQLPAVADLYPKGISIGVISKAYAIPGIRVGWTVCKDKSFKNKVIDIKAYLSICNSQVDEALTAELIKRSDRILQRNLKIILNNKKHLESLQAVFGHQVKFFLPNAGCSCFALINKDSDQLVKEIAQNKKYLLYPASIFFFKGHAVRVGFGYKDFEQRIQAIQ